LESVKSNVVRLGLDNVVCFCFDSTKLCSRGSFPPVENQSELERERELQPPFPPSTFDIVLLDPPCSGLGQRPVFKIEVDEKAISAHVTLQKTLFHQASHTL
jgi:16S rRNA C967 or C1407 C5-methylase (RsmB/RsmF family)